MFINTILAIFILNGLSLSKLKLIIISGFNSLELKL